MERKEGEREKQGGNGENRKLEKNEKESGKKEKNRYSMMWL